jgi:ASC-1-like (ASCH) protein
MSDFSTSWPRTGKCYRHTDYNDKGVKVYMQFYDKADEKDHGVLAIQVKVVSK